MPELYECERCGKAFVRRTSSERVCPECKIKDDEDLEIIKDFLIINPNSTIDIIEKNTNVSKKTILRLLEEGDLESENFSSGKRCVICGKPIDRGIYCDDCAKKVQEDLKRVSGSLDKKGGYHSR
jgi:predicted amidophosphoribosyltransferase